MGFQQRRTRPQPVTPNNVLPVVYTQTLTGSISSSGTTALQSQRIYPGSVSPSGALARKIFSNYFGSETTTGAILKAMTGRIFSGTVSPSGAMANLAVKVRAFAGTVTSSGALAEKVLRGFSGTVTSSGALIKKAFRNFAGTVTPSATLTAFKSFFTIAGTVTSSGLLIRKPVIIRSGTVTSSGIAGRSFSKLLSGVFSAGATTIAWDAVSGATGYKFYIGTATGLYIYDGSPIDVGNVLQYRITNLPNNPYFIAITAYNGSGESGFSSEISVTIAGGLYSALTQLKVSVKSIGGVLTPAAAIIKRVSKGFAGTNTSSGLSSNFAIAKRSYQGTVTSSGAIIRQPVKAIFAAVNSSGALIKKAIRNISGAVTPAGARISKSLKGFAGTVTSSGALSSSKLTNLFTITLSGGISSVGTLAKMAKRIWGGTIASIASVQTMASKTMVGTVTASGSAAMLCNKLTAGLVNLAGSIVKIPTRISSGVLQPIGNIVLSSISGLKLIVLVGVVTASGAIVKYVSAIKSGAINYSGILANRIGKSFDGSVSLAGTVQIRRMVNIALDGVVTLFGTLITLLSQAHFEIVRTRVISLVRRTKAKLIG